ncbi:MAG: BrnT family toxin [Candidatus Anammoxibacter sp.]
MEFEYDSNKSVINKQKHGLDFEEAKTIWSNTNVILPAITEGEQRYMIIGKIKTSLFSCVFTTRNKKTRIISCRRSRKKKGTYTMKKLKSKATSKEFDADFDNGKDMGDFLDIKKAKVNKKIQRINIDFPTSFLKKIDNEAQ